MTLSFYSGGLLHGINIRIAKIFNRLHVILPLLKFQLLFPESHIRLAHRKPITSGYVEA